MINRGEIRWFRFNKPDKRRPVLILTRVAGIQMLHSVTVAPIFSTRRGSPTEVYLDIDDGMMNPCAVNLDNLHTVSKKEIGARIVRLSDDKMEKVYMALAFALGFPPPFAEAPTSSP